MVRLTSVIRIKKLFGGGSRRKATKLTIVWIVFGSIRGANDDEFTAVLFNQVS